MEKMIIRPSREELQDTTGVTVGSDTMETGGDCEQNQRTVVGTQHKVAAVTVGNTTAPPLSTSAETAHQRSDSLLSESTQAGRQHRCMKWTDEINIFVMRAYHRITNLEIDFTVYRDQL